MASLYKKPILVTDPKTGQKIKARSRKWWGRYRTENGTERRVPLATDKTAAQAMLNELVKKVERRAAGLVDQFEDHRRRYISEHLADFDRHLKDKAVSSEHVKLVTARTRRIIEGCKAAFLGDLSASKTQAFLADLRANGTSTQTSNHYLRAIKQFTRWLVKDRRTSEDPLAHLAMLNVSLDRRHDRRPFSDKELHTILQVADRGPVVRRMAGPDRAMLYAVAAYTGLRASELASLTPESFVLDGPMPCVTVQAAYSKHRRQDVLPLHASLVALLRPWLATKPASQPVWPGKWAKGKEAGVMLRRDLEVAGIPYVDETGRYADFHALRHTFITNMVKSGIAPKSAQSLARHSTIDLTMNVYTSLTVHDQASALASLPPILAFDGREPVGAALPALQATGTDATKKVPTVVPRGAENGAVRLAPETYQPAPNCTEKGPEPEEGGGPADVESSQEIRGSCKDLQQSASDCTAERAGFEPAREQAPYRFSRPAHSATLAPLLTILYDKVTTRLLSLLESPGRVKPPAGPRRLSRLPPTA
jgi:integrase